MFIYSSTITTISGENGLPTDGLMTRSGIDLRINCNPKLKSEFDHVVADITGIEGTRTSNARALESLIALWKVSRKKGELDSVLHSYNPVLDKL